MLIHSQAIASSIGDDLAIGDGTVFTDGVGIHFLSFRVGNEQLLAVGRSDYPVGFL